MKAVINGAPTVLHFSCERVKNLQYKRINPLLNYLSHNIMKRSSKSLNGILVQNVFLLLLAL